MGNPLRPAKIPPVLGYFLLLCPPSPVKAAELPPAVPVLGISLGGYQYFSGTLGYGVPLTEAPAYFTEKPIYCLYTALQPGYKGIKAKFGFGVLSNLASGISVAAVAYKPYKEGPLFDRDYL